MALIDEALDDLEQSRLAVEDANIKISKIIKGIKTIQINGASNT